jgi:hypothetical protein
MERRRVDGLVRGDADRLGIHASQPAYTDRHRSTRNRGNGWPGDLGFWSFRGGNAS